MGYESITNDQIFDLINMKKVVMNPLAKFKQQGRFNRKNYMVQGDVGYDFGIYLRQNLTEEMEDDFSCGLLWIMPSGESLTLRRYNGSTHIHCNKLEKVKFEPQCHIHYATEHYIQAGLSPEQFAEPTGRYKTLEGALHCLVKDCNIANIQTTGDVLQQPTLF